MIIHFTLPGNQEDPRGNPVPYFRRNDRNRFSDGAKRYHAWMEFVKGHFWTAAYRFKDAQRMMDLKTGRLLVGKETKIEIVVRVWWADEKHGDLDNILKGILDSIFRNDKGVWRIDAEVVGINPKGGVVEVKIIINVDE